VLGLVARHSIPFERMRAELPRQSYIETPKLVDMCQHLSWLRANDTGLAVLTPRGARLAAAQGDAAKLRLALLDFVELASPPWVKLAIDGRNRVLTFAPVGVTQCLVEAELAVGHSDDVVRFWDQLAAAARGLRGTELSEIGRQGERLTLAYEKKRTGREPQWRSIESNADGYDVLSVAAAEDTRPMQIEVKASRIGVSGVMHVTRNEWEATELMLLHKFHLWDISVSGTPRLAVISRAEMAPHAPADSGVGHWEAFEVPFSAFANRFTSQGV
jgi:hypothetical protein